MVSRTNKKSGKAHENETSTPRSMYSPTKLISNRFDSAYIQVLPATVAINKSKLTDFAARLAETLVYKVEQASIAKKLQVIVPRQHKPQNC